MLEILRKIESGASFSDVDEGDSSDAGSLDWTEERLNGLTKEELLGLLTEEQIEEFDRKLSNGHLDPTFIQATISSHCHDPWWLDSQPGNSTSPIDLVDQSILPVLPDGLNPQLFYHVFSLSLGYVSLLRCYGLRSLAEATEEDCIDLLSDLPKFFPILFDSELRLESIAECFGLFLKNLPNMGPESIPFLIKDIRFLFPDSSPKLKTNLIIEITSDGKPIPNERSLCSLALSDLYRFLNTHNWGHIRAKSQQKSIMKKLLFFISFSIDSTRLDRFAQEIDDDDSRLGSDLNKDDNGNHLNPNELPFSNLLVGDLSDDGHHLARIQKPPKIIETSSNNDNV